MIKKERPVRILILDDNEDDLLLLQKAIGKTVTSVKVIPFSDSLEAINFLYKENLPDRNKPDLIFLDINMPGLDGKAILNLLKVHPQLQNIKIIVISSGMTDSRKQELLSLGAHQVHSKPGNHQALVTLVGQVLGKSPISTHAKS